MGIGWHFFQEGTDKLESGNFSSVGFLKSAKGPLAPMYHSMVWDADGTARLDEEKTLDAWKQYRQQLINHYGFDDKQKKRADDVFQRRLDQLEYFFAVNAEEINEYFLGLERRDRNRADAARMEVASLRGQAEQIESDLAKMRGPWLAELDKLWKGLEKDLNEVAASEQASRGYFAIAKPGRSFMDSLTVDKIIPYFDVTIGICLFLGLFTRIAAIAGAFFLCSVILSQWPGAPGTMPTYYQSIEFLALIVLAAVGAGRFAGLDFFINFARMRCCPPKQEKKS